MTTPNNPPLEILLPPNRRGERIPAFLNPYRGTYTTSRSYALRMQSGYRRGLTQAQARRGAGSVSELSESQRRRARTQAQYGMTPWQRYNITFQQQYGFSYSYWRYLRKNWIAEINQMAAPDAQITPVFIAQALANQQLTGHNEEWIEQRLQEKLEDMHEYRAGNAEPGFVHWNQKEGMEPIEWWWYH